MIEYKPTATPSSIKEDLIIDGKKWGTIDMVNGMYRVHLTELNWLNSCFGHGATREEALRDAIEEGRKDFFQCLSRLDILAEHLISNL